MFKAKTELRILQYFYYRGTEAKAEKPSRKMPYIRYTRAFVSVNRSYNTAYHNTSTYSYTDIGKNRYGAVTHHAIKYL